MVDDARVRPPVAVLAHHDAPPAGIAEVDLSGASAVEGLAGRGEAFGVRLPAVDADDEAAVGAWIGRLVAALDQGATFVRTPEVARARRVVAVVEAVEAGRRRGARMAP